MDATFSVIGAGSVRVCLAPDPLPPDAEPGKLYSATMRVGLAVNHFGETPIFVTMTKSVARAIGSALMGAAAEL